MFREPRYFELKLMATDEAAKPDWLYRKFRRAGYIEEDAEIMTASMMRMIITRERWDYIRALMDLYKEGYVTEEQFDTLLDPLGLTETAHNLLKRTAEFKYLKDRMDDMIRFAWGLYHADIITGDEFETMLVGIGIKEEKVRMLRSITEVKKKQKILQRERREVEAAMREQQRLLYRKYTEMYRAGTIDKHQYIGFLIGAGMTPEYATMVADIEEQRKLQYLKRKEMRAKETEARRLRERYKKIYTLQFRENKITQDQFYNALLAINFSQEEARAIVMLEVERKGGTIAALREADVEEEKIQLREKYVMNYRDLYRAGKITKEQLYSYLYNLRLYEDEIEKILQDEEEFKQLFVPI